MSILTVLLACRPPSPATPTELRALQEGQIVEGFAVEAIYVDDGQRPLGVRLAHQHTGFELAMFQLQTAPQAYLWVDTVPDGDQGEPHTQEHLLLGKGNRGRTVATLEDMSLVASSAFTEQLRTVYHFHTTASPDVFFDVLGARLGALLYPDYTDEEIRREVHHYGVRSEADGTLALEEKGTVYNEMDSSYQRPWANLWRQIGLDLYGEGHPMALESGGLPSAIRTMKPEHIRDFHARTYQLANMGMIAVLPTDVPLPHALAGFDAVLTKAQPAPTPPGTTFATSNDLPEPRPSTDRAVRDIVYPHGDDAADASVVVAYPPVRELPPQEQSLLGLLLTGLAGNDNANLYKAMVDSQSRERDTGATDVWSWASDDLGSPVYIGVTGVPSAKLDAESVRWMGQRVQQELATIAALEPGDPALLDLQRRLQGALIDWRRSLRKSVGAPPGFGARGTDSGWFDLLESVDESGGFLRSLTMQPAMVWMEAQIERDDNPWAEWLPAWGLLEEPLVYANRPSPEALASLSASKEARLAATVEAMVEEMGVADAQSALAQFQEAYLAETAALDALAEAPDVSFVEAPPLVNDPTLSWTTGEVQGIPAFKARFDSMTGADVRLFLRLDGISAAHSRWLPVLDDLLTGVGVLIDGEPVPHTEVIERLQREVLSAGAWLESNARVGRAELALRASGTDADEVAAALTWARRFLTTPDWRPENLARIRDVVKATLSGLQSRMQGSEESWVDNPQRAIRFGDRPLQLRLWSFLTQAHDVHRLLWRLTEPGSGRGPALARELAKRADRLDREGLLEVLAVLQGQEAQPPIAGNRVLRAAELVPEEEAPFVVEFAAGIERAVAGMPDATLRADVGQLCEALAVEWETDPQVALTELAELRASLLRTGGARLVMSGGAWLETADEAVVPLLEVLEAGEVTTAAWTTHDASLVRGRVTARGGQGAAAHLGLLDPNRRSGVHIHTAPGPQLLQTDESSVLDYLAGNTWSGGGAHALFMRTWGAGLAYSNGSSSNPVSGTTRYYAERCPSLGQTLDFVIDELNGASITPEIAEYAVANAFWSRSARGYESRASAMASDLQDGVTPEVVQAFREAVLAARGLPDLDKQLQSRFDGVYARAVPGFVGGPAEGATYFVVGDDAQLTGWSAWLQAKGAGDLERVYPRDFWIVDDLRQ